VELGSDAQRSLAATSILSRSGERTATIEHLERAYAMTDDPAMKNDLLQRLIKLKGSADAEAVLSVVEREWRSRYAFMSRGQALLIGPSRSAAACAGPGSIGRRECAADWTAAVAESK
jgi:hypothetical protein